MQFITEQFQRERELRKTTFPFPMTSIPRSYSKPRGWGHNPDRNSARRLRSASPRWPHSSGSRPAASALNINTAPRFFLERNCLPAGTPTAATRPQPGRPLLFLHPGHGFELLAFPAAPRRAPLLGGGRLAADGGRAFEEGLHGCGCDRPSSSPSPRLRAAVKPSASQRAQAHRRAHPATTSRQAAATQGEAEPLPPAESQSQRPTRRSGRAAGSAAHTPLSEDREVRARSAMLAPPLGAGPGGWQLLLLAGLSKCCFSNKKRVKKERERNRNRAAPKASGGGGLFCQDAGAVAWPRGGWAAPWGESSEEEPRKPESAPVPALPRLHRARTAAAARAWAVPRCYESSSPRCTKRGLYGPKLPVNRRGIFFSISITSR